MSVKIWFPKMMLFAAFFWMFSIVSCANDPAVVETPSTPKPPVDTPTPEPPVVEPPDIDTPEIPEPPNVDIVMDPDIDGVNACVGRSARDVTNRPGTRSLEAQPKIVGGRPTNTNKWPWAVAIHEVTTGGEMRQFCGGSVIGDKWVLTAAHCKVRSSDKMVVGRSNLTGSEGHELNVKRVIEHCNYDPQTNDSDIALVEVEVPTGVTLKPVDLIDRGEPSAQPGADATIVGWGRLQMGGSTSDTLQEVTVPIQTNALCEQGYPNDITANMLCAGKPEGGQDSCQGDSGGPLVVTDPNGNFQQAGVVSWGEGCALPNKLGVYSRVGRYLPWIKATMNGE